METVAASAGLATATVLALRGRHDEVPPLFASALASIDAAETGRPPPGPGMPPAAPAAEGSYVTAYARLGRLFESDGTPLHPHVSYLAVADFAAAAARAERRLEAQTLLERALAQAVRTGTPAQQLAARARVLAPRARQRRGSTSAKALATRRRDRWPFERAQLRLDYGESGSAASGGSTTPSRSSPPASKLPPSRRRARDRRAEAELRACGVTARRPPPRPTRSPS